MYENGTTATTNNQQSFTKQLCQADPNICESAYSSKATAVRKELWFHPPCIFTSLISLQTQWQTYFGVGRRLISPCMARVELKEMTGVVQHTPSAVTIDGL